MGRVEAYEHRGARYRSLETETQAQVQAVLDAFHEEKDIWLKKILALKLDNQGIWPLSASDAALVSEAIQCRIES